MSPPPLPGVILMYDGYRYAVYTDQTGRVGLTPRQARRFAKKMRRRDKRLFGLGS